MAQRKYMRIVVSLILSHLWLVKKNAKLKGFFFFFKKTLFKIIYIKDHSKETFTKQTVILYNMCIMCVIHSSLSFSCRWTKCPSTTNQLSVNVPNTSLSLSVALLGPHWGQGGSFTWENVNYLQEELLMLEQTVTLQDLSSSALAG